jgi:cytoskeletal protein CcmA (bactofilin family)
MAAIVQLRRGSTEVSLQEAELYLNYSSGAIQFGSGSEVYSLLPINAPAYGDINLQGNISASGDVRIGGNIYLGNATADNIQALGQFTTNLVPNGTIDIGTTSSPWTNIYTTNISASSIIGSFSGSIIGFGNVTQFSASVDGRLDSLETFQNSEESKNTTLASYTSSVNANLTELYSTASNHENRIDVLEDKQTTLGNYTSSIDSKFTTLGSYTSSVDIHISSINVFSASEESKNSTLASYTSSINDKFVAVQSSTSSLNAYTASNNLNVAELFWTASNHEGRIDSIEEYTSSLKTAIDVTDGNTTIKGNLTVVGTTTAVQSSTLNVADKNIRIASGSTSSATSDGAGVTIDGANVTLVWSDTNQRIELNKNLGIEGSISSSTIVGLNGASVNAYSWSVDDRLKHLQDVSQSHDARLLSLETETGSLESRATTLSIVTASLNTFTASAEGRLNNIEQFSASQEGKDSVLETYTSSIDAKFDEVEAATSSLNSYTASNTFYRNQLFDTASDHESRIDILEAKQDTILIVTSSLMSTTASLYWTASNHEDRIDVLESKQNTLETYTASIDSKFSVLQTTTASLMNATASFNTWTGSVYNPFSSSVDSRLDELEYTTSINLGSGAQISFAALQAYTASQNIKHDNLAIYTASVNADLSALHAYTQSLSSIYEEKASATHTLVSGSSQIVDILSSLNSYTNSLDNAIELTGSTVSFLGDIVVYGTQSIINSENLAINDNLIYLNEGSTITNPDLGVVGNYNDGTYGHTGIFRDASDNGTWKVFKGYTLEPSGTIDTSHASFTLADFRAATITGDTIVGSIAATNGVISSSAQINSIFEEKASATHTLVSSSVQILGGTGIVSGSSQISYIGLSNIPNGIVSGSSQIIPLLPTGVVSGSSQLTTEFDARYLNTLGEGIVSSSSQINLGSAAGNITLATQTTGDYVASLVAGTGITITNNSGENATPTIAIGQAVATSSNVQFASIGVGTAASGIAGEIIATGDIVAFSTSDERLKENITPIPNALEKVNQISGNTYDWKEGFELIHSHAGNDIGVIAQEIEKVIPQAVIDRAAGYKAVNYEKIVPLLIEAIKELSAKIDRLENK